jgi:hypothetical protein
MLEHPTPTPTPTPAPTPTPTPTPAPAPPVVAVAPVVKQVTVFEDVNWLGKSNTIAEGRYTLNDFRKIGIADNAISSVAVPPDTFVILYDNDGFTGKNYMISQSIPALGNYNDLASSIIVTKSLAQIGDILVFSEGPFTGPFQIVNRDTPFIGNGKINYVYIKEGLKFADF